MTREDTVYSNRPVRFLEIGEIPQSLPSAYDAIYGEFGLPNLVSQPLHKHYKQYRNSWLIETAEDPDPAQIYQTFKTFLDVYVGSNYDTNWDAIYRQLAAISAQGWIREERARGAIGNVSENTVDVYAEALSYHLKASEQRWGIAWLTSEQPIESQNDSMMLSIEKHYRDYSSGVIPPQEFYLNVAGEVLIRQIRSNTSHQKLKKWNQTADNFVSRGF